MIYKTFEKEINGNKYTIQAFKGTCGLSLLAEFLGYVSTFLKLFSKDLSANFSIATLLETSLEENALDKVIDELQTLLLVRDEREKLIDFIQRLVANTSRNEKDDLSKTEIFDIAFSANYEELFVLVKEIIIANFFSQSFMKNLVKKNLQETTNKGKIG